MSDTRVDLKIFDLIIYTHVNISQEMSNKQTFASKGRIIEFVETETRVQEFPWRPSPVKKWFGNTECSEQLAHDDQVHLERLR